MTEPTDTTQPEHDAAAVTEIPQKDPLADAYRRVRDATKVNERLNPAEALAVLEQVKFEILRDNQGVIDVSIMQDQLDAGATVG